MPKYGCLMLPMPDRFAKTLIRWAEENIDPTHLHGDAIERFSHCTLKYGFVNEPGLLGRIRTFLSEIPPPTITVSGLSHFPDSGDGDVLKLDVQGQQIHEIYHAISREFDCVDKWHPRFRPHVTIAYLTPGMGAKYRRLDPPPPFQSTIPRAVYSDALGTKSDVHFALKRGKTLSWMDSSLGGALVPEPEFAPKLIDLMRVRYKPRRTMLAPVVKSWDRRGNELTKNQAGR